MISNWAHIKVDKSMNCTLWWFMFEKFKEHFKSPPSGCQKCWKVCVKPKSITDLLTIERMQEATKDKYIGCKCGTEPRAYVNALYGAYWYSKSKEDGLKALEEVRKDLKEWGIESEAVLKRGCTEYEMQLGDSQNWHGSLDQIALEGEIERQMVEEFGKDKIWSVEEQGKEERDKIRQDWIKCACSFGDKEYIHHVPKPLHAICRVYA